MNQLSVLKNTQIKFFAISQWMEIFWGDLQMRFSLSLPYNHTHYKSHKQVVNLHANVTLAEPNPMILCGRCASNRHLNWKLNIAECKRFRNKQRETFMCCMRYLHIPHKTKSLMLCHKQNLMKTPRGQKESQQLVIVLIKAGLINIRWLTSRTDTNTHSAVTANTLFSDISLSSRTQINPRWE